MNSVHSHLLMNFTAHFEYGCDAIPKNVVKQVLPHTWNAYFYFWHPFSIIITMFRSFSSIVAWQTNLLYFGCFNCVWCFKQFGALILMLKIHVLVCLIMITLNSITISLFIELTCWFPLKLQFFLIISIVIFSTAVKFQFWKASLLGNKS